MKRTFFNLSMILAALLMAVGPAYGVAVEEEVLSERGAGGGDVGPLQCVGAQETTCYATGSGAVLLRFAGGRGLFLKLDDARDMALMVRFNTEDESYVSLQVDPDCVKEISSAIQALLSAAHNCVYNVRPFKCAEDLLDFITQIYLIMVECGAATG